MMELQTYIRAHADGLLKDLATLIQIPSVEGEPTPDAPYGS